ncbi:hypothetical protein ANO11243_078380 [Dothideomycetidae sp. 11243]|nr:hypothetical protein ANO11243_078380 [fungal sp. No.11243]
MPGVQLFSEKKFFLLQRVPSRVALIGDIERLGGRVVKLETQAEYVIADHLRKDAPAGALSYTFIEAAVKSGDLPNEQDHRISTAPLATSSARLVGSHGMSRPSRNTRTPFTAEDDRVLLDWVTSRAAQGASLLGNEIYKDLEIENPRHTFQSWRDRYVKTLRNRMPLPTVTAPPTPPSEPQVPFEELRQPARSATQRTQPKNDVEHVRTGNASRANTFIRLPPGFTQEDLESLVKEAGDIEDIPYSRWDAAWEAWAAAHGTHSAKSWESFYKTHGHQEYMKREAAKNAKGSQPLAAESGIVQLDGSMFSRPTKAPVEDRKVLSRPATSAPQKRTHLDMSTSPVGSQSKDKEDSLARNAVKRRRIDNDETLDLIRRRSSQQSGPPKSELRQSQPINSERQTARPTSVPITVQAAKLRLTSQTSKGGDGKHSVSPIPDDEPRRNAQTTQTPAERSLKEHPFRKAFQRSLSSDAMHAQPSSSNIPALTEENLAQMQAQQKELMHGRAKDLPEDDQDKDQTEFADLLQSILPETMTAGLWSGGRPTFRSFPDEEIPESEVSARPSTSDVSSPELGTPPKESAPLPRASSEASSDKTATLRRTSTRMRTTTFAQSPHKHTRHSGSRNAFAEVGNGTPSTNWSTMPQAVMLSSPPTLPRHAGSSQLEIISQTIELDLPEPVGGWYAVLSSELSEHQLPEFNSDTDVQRTGDKIYADTQAIFDVDTQALDLELPDIDDNLKAGADSENFKPRKARRSDYDRNDSRPPSPIDSGGEDLEGYIQAKLRAGHKESHVLRALEATSMQKRLAENALMFLARGRPLPKTVAGIWTEEDDKDLYATDPVKLAGLERKHGAREVERRHAFMEELSK